MAFSLFAVIVAISGLIVSTTHAQSLGDYNANYGTYVGELRGSQIAGRVYAASNNAIVIQGLQFGRGLTTPTFYVGPLRTLSPATGTELTPDGSSPLQSGAAQDVVLRLPNAISSYQSLGLFDKSSGRNTARQPTFANCERFSAGGRTIEVSWNVQTTPPYLYVQLEAPLAANEYMAWGISGDTQGVLMKGGDVAVTYIDPRTGQGQAIDYSLDDYSQCTGTTGACPDTELGGQNNVEFIAASQRGGVTRIVWRKPLDRGDRKDIVIDINNPMYSIWAIGPLNSKNQVSYHNLQHAQRTDDTRLLFTRSAKSRCPGYATAQDPSTPPVGVVGVSDTNTKPSSTLQDAIVPPQTQAANRGAWQPAQLFGDQNNRRFIVVIGPAGGKKGYTGITGTQSWGIAYYVNGRLIPELILQRGVEYEFDVLAGNDASMPAKYHPLYITTDPEGGFGQKTPQEQAAERYLAGIERTPRSYNPTAAGSLCELKAPIGTDAERFNTFEEYNRTLTLNCKDAAPGQLPLQRAGVLRFRPDNRTPDIVYYQCYQHRNLGWRIRIVNNLNDARREFLASASANDGSAGRYAAAASNAAAATAKSIMIPTILSISIATLMRLLV